MSILYFAIFAMGYSMKHLMHKLLCWDSSRLISIFIAGTARALGISCNEVKLSLQITTALERIGGWDNSTHSRILSI